MKSADPFFSKGGCMGRVIDAHHHCYRCHLLAALWMRDDDDGHGYLLYIYISLSLKGWTRLQLDKVQLSSWSHQLPHRERSS